MAIADIAQGLVTLCKQGKFSEAVNAYYSPNIVSIEAMGENPVAQGLDAIHAKMEWFKTSMEVHEAIVEGPYINGDQFGVRFKLDTTDKTTGKRNMMDEFGVYTVKDNKIVHERFFNGIS